MPESIVDLFKIVHVNHQQPSPLSAGVFFHPQLNAAFRRALIKGLGQEVFSAASIIFPFPAFPHRYR